MVRKLTTAVLVAAIAIGVWQLDNIYEWWWLRTYQPTTEIVALADKASLSAPGRREFYLGNPQLNDKGSFSANCPVNETSLILGCYSGGQIFVLKVERTELAGVMEVTAAHEMLHAAYAELRSGERRRVNQLIEDFYGQYDEPGLQHLVAEYERTEPGQRLNELHSLLGTQVASLSPELEEYYSQYFKDRSQVVAAYTSYENVFRNLEQKIDGLASEIDSLKQQIINLEQQLDSQRAELERTNERMNSLLSQGRVDEYNALVPTQNSQVQQYNLLVGQYQALVNSHNSKVEQINALALEQNQLRDSLDSSKQPISN